MAERVDEQARDEIGAPCDGGLDAVEAGPVVVAGEKRLAVDLRGGPARLRQFLVNGVAVEPFLDCPGGTMRTRDVVVAIRACD